MRDVVWEPASACKTFSSEKYPTLQQTLPVLEFMQEKWEQMAREEKYERIKDGIESGLRNLRKWYRSTDETDIYFISLGKLLLAHTSHTDQV